MLIRPHYSQDQDQFLLRRQAQKPLRVRRGRNIPHQSAQFVLVK